MKKITCIRLFAALSIICVLAAGIYLNVSGNYPNTLSSRAVMVFGEIQINGR